jgi:CRP-like cAMP-binding protein
VPAVPLIHDNEIWEKRLATFPLAACGAGETVFTEGTKTGRLLILKAGLVSVIKGGTEIAQVAELGVIFGELSALLDQPHTADVRTVEPSQFHVADAAALLGQDPVALLHIGTALARRLDDSGSRSAGLFTVPALSDHYRPRGSATAARKAHLKLDRNHAPPADRMWIGVPR